MPKVKEMSFAEAQKGLKAADAALQTAAQHLAAAKAPDKEKAILALRAAALDFSSAERYARSAKARETKSDLFS